MADVLVLCYHAVSDRWESPLAVTRAQLARQLAFLVRRGYRGATFEQAATASPAARTLAVTFDDGYRSVLTHARPILDRLGLPGTVFAPTDFVGRDEPMSWPGIDHWVGGPHADELVPMTWEQLIALRDGGWEIGSHTCSHPRLSRLDDAAVKHELLDSRRTCEARLGACRTLALPYGDGNARVLAIAEEVGYRAVAGLPGADAAEPAGWPRVGVYPVDNLARFTVKVARPVRRLRRALGG
ncbi:MAG TPA: polysaccharide deacetylase family protein [Solirubrobacter sp.]|nr:polysaccharide deacetylase family protein [Solirubrobacter sp.]